MSKWSSFFDEMVEDFEGLFAMRPPARGYRVHKSEDEVVVEVDVPGAKPEDVEVHVEGSVLHVDWKRKTASGEASGSHAFRLSTSADAQSVQARVEHGVLTVRVPRKPRAQATKVKVTG